jgi:hypothetical protein
VLLPSNLGSDEIDPINAFRREEIVPSVQNVEKTLLVTAIDRKWPRMFYLESRS